MLCDGVVITNPTVQKHVGQKFVQAPAGQITNSMWCETHFKIPPLCSRSLTTSQHGKMVTMTSKEKSFSSIIYANVNVTGVLNVS
jgi:hypothetical protein